MASPEEKAKELFWKCKDLADDCGSPYPKEHGMDIARFCVAELIGAASPSVYRDGNSGLNQLEYYHRVKEEIIKI